MKSDHSMESNESTEDRDRRNRDFKKDGDNEMDIGRNKVDSDLVGHKSTSEAKIESRWDNLIYIDIQFYINDFLFKEELLWDKRYKSPSEIKEFCCYLLRENAFNQENKEEIKQTTCDFLESCGEFMTRRITEEIKIYDKFQPYILFKEGVFGQGTGIDDDHVINVKIDLTHGNITYKDSFEWDILNEDNVPEEFASIIVKEYKLPNEFLYLIALSIRKNIKQHVFAILGAFTQVYLSLKEVQKMQNPPKTISNKKSHLLNETTISIPIYFDKEVVKEKESKITGSTRALFTTYNTNAQVIQPQIEKPVMINFKRYVPYNSNDELAYLDNKLQSTVPYLLEPILEKQLGKKIKRNTESIGEPEFLKNSIKPPKLERKISTNSKTSLPVTKRSSNITKFNKKPPTLNTHQKEKNYDNNSNVTVKETGKTILINKDIMKYKDYYEIIVIEKKTLLDFKTDI